MPPLPIPGSWQKFHRANLIKCSLEQTVGSGYVCEFGVLTGRTLNQIAGFFKNEDVDYVPVSMETGKISSTDILNSIQPNTCLVSVMLANNETGVIMPVEEISM